MPLTDEEIQAQQRAVELNRKIRGKVPTPPEDTPQESLGDLLQSDEVTWQFSESGAGGALLGVPNGPGVKGAAVKTENMMMVRKAHMVSTMIETFLHNAEGPPPFSAPRTTVLTGQDLAQNPQLSQGLLAHLNQVDTTVPPFLNSFKGDDFNAAKQALTDGGEGRDITHGVLVMEFAEGKQANRLPVSDKVALLKSEAFAGSIGRAIAPSMVLGLTDHLGLTGGAGVSGGGFKTNVSNFMYNPESGTLSVIDYDTPMDFAPPANDPNIFRFGPNQVDKRFAELRTYLEHSMESQESFDAAIENLMNPSGTTTPLTPVMRSFWNATDDDSFFSLEQQDEIEKLSPEDKRQFAINIMKGAIDGLEYVQKNQQALKTAALNAREDVNGLQVNHFFSDQQLQDLENEMALLQPDDMRNRLSGLAQTNTENHNTAQRQQLAGPIDTYVADLDQKEAALRQRLDEVQRKIDRIKNHPTFGDTLKKAFTPKGHRPIAKFREEQGKLDDELQFIGNLKIEATQILQNLQARQQFQTNMRDVESLVTPPQQDVPQVDNAQHHNVQGGNIQVENVQVENVQVDNPRQVQIEIHNNIDVDVDEEVDAPKQDKSDLILDLDDLDVDESVRAKLKAPPKDNRTQLREKIESDKLGLNRQRAKPRLRDTNPDIGKDQGGDTSHGTGHSVT